MGGSAFSPTLYTPRMPPRVYAHVLTEVHRKLRTLYAHVETPIEAPAKPDYGDVDVLVYELLPGWTQTVESATATATTSAPTETEIAVLLGAKTWKRDRGSEELHLALPWPGEFASENEGTPSAAAQTQTSKTTPPSSALDDSLTRLSFSSTPTTAQHAYIQVDLHICSSLRTYKWQLFRCAHGDFCSILGSVIRRYGLSFRNTGLYIRIAEVEKVSRKMALVQLSDTPAEVLGFLFNGAEEDFWRRDKFASVEGMFDFIRRECRFYRPLREHEKPGDADHDGEGGEVHVHVPKKDRSRFIKRGAFRRWLEEYVPKHSPADRQDGVRGEYAGMTREEVSQMVKERFDVAEEYDAKQRVGLRQVGVERLHGDLRAAISIPPPQVEQEQDKTVGDTGIQGQLEPNFVLRTLRRKLSIEARDKTDGELDEVQRAYREGRFEEVKGWAERNWKEVAESKWKENAEKSAIHYREKMEGVERKDAAGAGVVAANDADEGRAGEGAAVGEEHEMKESGK